RPLPPGPFPPAELPAALSKFVSFEIPRHPGRYAVTNSAGTAGAALAAFRTPVRPRGSFLISVRHEVAVVAVLPSEDRRDGTRCSASGILPGRASLVTAGCEAPG